MYNDEYFPQEGGGPRVVVSTATFHALEIRVRFQVSVAVWKKQKCFFPIHS